MNLSLFNQGLHLQSALCIHTNQTHILQSQLFVCGIETEIKGKANVLSSVAWNEPQVQRDLPAPPLCGF